jgi:MFS transporter, DHA2 family, methylenomycin A resistance protein
MTDTREFSAATTKAETKPPRRDHASAAALGVAMLGFFVVAMDSQIVNVALPSIRGDLGGGLSGLQWVVTTYTLAFSTLILFAGTFSERIGAKRAYGIGMAVFVVASAVCGLVPNVGPLIATRFVKGAGAALITPTSLALTREAYSATRRPGRAPLPTGPWAGPSPLPPVPSSAVCSPKSTGA